MIRILVLLILISGSCFGQNEILSLDSCVHMAKQNYPLIKQNHLIVQSQLTAQNINRNEWLPKINFSTKATFQSEVISFLGMTFPWDNYLTSLSLEQTLYDGGLIKEQLNLDKLSGENSLIANEVELYKLIDRINQLYSAILINRESIKTLSIYTDDINSKKNILSASVRNGLTLVASLDELEAEALKTEQSIIETKENLSALYHNLGMFINKSINDSTQFVIDDKLDIIQSEEIKRPEIRLYDSQKLLIEGMHNLYLKSEFPRISIGAEGNYGRPGPNFLNQNQRFFGSANIGLKWNIGSFYNRHNENQKLNINIQQVDVQKEVFEFNLKATLANEKSQISSLKMNIQKDKLIIEKRHNISLTASNQLENGTITTTDYLIQLNAEMQAVLNQKIHEIKLMNAIANYNTTLGITNF